VSTDTSTTILTAAWIAPISTAPIPDAAIAIQNQHIAAVGPIAAIRAAFPGAAEIDLGNSTLLPGLVNAHVHLDLTNTPRPEAPGSFLQWVEHVISDAMKKASAHALAVGMKAVVAGMKQCVQYGVTGIGDVAARQINPMRSTIEVSAKQRGTSYGEVTAMATRRGLLEEKIIEATFDGQGAWENLRVGISPHAPYSVEPQGYRRCLEVARKEKLPLATHLAETPYEAEFLASHTGPLRELWEWLKGWDDQVPTFTGGPIRYAQALGLLDYPTLLAHVNYCDDDELSILAAGRASVVYCPRTHAYFGHPPHRFRDMLARGINVALGTDSCASSPDLNLLDDLRLVHRIAPEMAVADKWRLITVNAARAIDFPSIGSLAPGNWADVIAFPTSDADPLREILESTMTPSRVWLGGHSILPYEPRPEP
jgi:cytosine/adenosine deaminase-related metal-dependent hydrolase